jgi:NTE family protein
MSTYRPVAAAFEGGGVLIPGHVGAISVFHELGLISGMTKFAGTSAGSIMAMVCAVRAPIKYIEDLTETVDFKEFQDDSFGVVRDLTRFAMRGGWCKGDSLYDFAGDSLKELTGDSSINFAGVYNKYGTELTITGYNASYRRTDYFNHINTPEMEVRDAIRISCSIPGMYAYYQYKGSWYSDGGIKCNYPINVFRDIQDEDGDQVVGFKLMTGEELDTAESGNSFTQIDNGIDALITTIEDLHASTLRQHVDSNDWMRTVIIPVGSSSSMNFEMSADEKARLYKSGRDGAEKFLAGRKI